MAKKAGTTGKGGLVDRVYTVLALTYFLIATLMLMLLALAIVGIAIWEGVLRLLEGKMMEAVLDAIAALIIGFAIMETANFVNCARRASRAARSPSSSPSWSSR